MGKIYWEAIGRFPDGCTVRHVKTGTLALVGSHTPPPMRVVFWLMTLGANPRKGTVGAAAILRDYEIAESLPLTDY